MKKLLTASLLLTLLTTSCTTTTSWRFTGFEVNNFTPEKLTASRDADRVVYDRGGSELSEGVVKSPPEYEDGEEPSWISDVWTALVSIIPDWNVRITLMKFEYDDLGDDAEEKPSYNSSTSFKEIESGIDILKVKSNGLYEVTAWMTMPITNSWYYLGCVTNELLGSPVLEEEE